MSVSSFCDACGAALPTSASSCPVCGQAQQTDVQPHFSLTAPLQSGFLLMGHYRILEKIGEGGFGLVYKARDMKEGRLVAIKQISLTTLNAQEMIEVTDSYNREITFLPKLQHKNLPLIYDYFTDPEHWYIVLEYIDGQTLEKMLTKAPEGFLPVKEVLHIGSAMCDVLGYLHVQKPPIIFRDVKPANIMISQSGDIYLIDFGIARRYREGQRKDTGALGSPGYASPEQYGKTQTTPQTDIYGLGATLQTLLTGKEPFEIQAEGIPAHCSIPTQVQGLINRMMDRDLDKRPASMEMVQRALQKLLLIYYPAPAKSSGGFAWLETLWSLFMLVSGALFFSGLLLSLFCFLVMLCIIAFHFYKAKQDVPGKLTRKDARPLAKYVLTKSDGSVFGCLGWLLFSIFASLFSVFHITTLIAGIAYLILYIAGIQMIRKGLVPFLNRSKQGNVTPQGQQIVQASLIVQQIRKRP